MNAAGGNVGPARWDAARAFVLLLSVLLILAITVPGAAQAISNSATETQNPSSGAVVLDRVVAVVGEQTILASDVDEEMRFAALQASASSADVPSRALDRVIDRTLIDEQRALQPGVAQISQKDVDSSIADLRETIPACVSYRCTTDAGWLAFLAAEGFTSSEVEERVRERLAILKFIDLRFGVAARVPNSAARKYYDDVLTPALQRKKAVIPEFNVVAPRIREILRQQQVSDLVDQWLRGMRSEEHVRILNAAYAEGNSR